MSEHLHEMWERGQYLSMGTASHGEEGKSVQSRREEHLLALKTSSEKAPRRAEADRQSLVLLENRT